MWVSIAGGTWLRITTSFTTRQWSGRLADLLGAQLVHRGRARLAVDVALGPPGRATQQRSDASLMMPISWKGTLIQYVGRIQRIHPSNRFLRIHDYVDRQIPMLGRMIERRVRGDRSI